MPHRDDCMVKTGQRPVTADDCGVTIEVDACDCLAMLRGEVNAWLAAAAQLANAKSKDMFLSQARYLMGLVEQAEQRHALQRALG